MEVDPESIRRGNDMYKKAELSLWIAFMEKFPEADLLICEPSNANDMTNCLFQSNSGEMMLERWESFWSENLLFSSNVTHLSKKSAYFKSNEYDNLNEYTLAA